MNGQYKMSIILFGRNTGLERFNAPFEKDQDIYPTMFLDSLFRPRNFGNILCFTVGLLRACIRIEIKSRTSEKPCALDEEEFENMLFLALIKNTEFLSTMVYSIGLLFFFGKRTGLERVSCTFITSPYLSTKA